jgi:signal transduction histidine kinase
MHRAYSKMKDFENAYLIQNKLLELQSIAHKENYANRLAFLKNTIEAKDKEQKLTVVSNEFNETFAHIDPFRVKQLIANLYSNAKKYTYKNGEIDVHFAACERYFKIIVQDSAPSVPKEHLGQIFDHLFRVPNMSNTETPGHGIGLSIVKQIVDLHNGEINASERELGGLKIEVDLPLN